MENTGLALEMRLKKVMSLKKHFHIPELGSFKRCSGHSSSSLCVQGDHIKTADIRPLRPQRKQKTPATHAEKAHVI